MTSLLVAKQPGGVLRVHDESISNNLLEENEEQKVILLINMYHLWIWTQRFVVKMA